VVIAAPAGAQGPTAPPSASPPPSADVRLLPSPRLRFGDAVTIEGTVKLLGDFSRFDPVIDQDDEDPLWRRRRIGIKGELFNRITFEIERELGDDDNPWRDVYGNVKAHDLLEVRGGKFRLPFSLDNLTGSTSHDFIFRSLGARTLGFGRDVGVMVHGRADGRKVTYAVGVFDSGEVRDSSAQFFDDDEAGQNDGRAVAGRMTVQPFDGLNDWPRGLRNLEIGVSVARERLLEGLNGLSGRSVHRYDFFAPVYVNGHRRRFGADIALFAGPTSLKAEWIETRDDRKNQGLGDVDLPTAFGRAWYLAGTWVVTGEDRDGDVTPRRPFLRGGIGAVEATVRLERLGFGSTSSDGEPAFANPRAANLLRNHDQIGTFGITWYLNRWMKLQGNAIREAFEDPERAPIVGRAVFWSYVGRLQFVL
jgi:phosphate-selective porin